MEIKIANSVVGSIPVENNSGRDVTTQAFDQTEKIVHYVNEGRPVQKISKTEQDDPQYIENTSNTIIEKKEEDDDLLEEILENIYAELNTSDQEIAFSYNNDIKQMLVTVTNKGNGKVIRQIPADYVVRIMEKFHASGKIEGLLLKEKV